MENKINKIKNIFKDTYNESVYSSAELDYKYTYELVEQDKETIIDSYYNLFRIVRDIKEILDEK